MGTVWRHLPCEAGTCHGAGATLRPPRAESLQALLYLVVVAAVHHLVAAKSTARALLCELRVLKAGTVAQ